MNCLGHFIDLVSLLVTSLSILTAIFSG